MSQQVTSSRPPVNGIPPSSTLAHFQPVLPDYSAFPGLNSISQSLTSPSQTSVPTSTQQQSSSHPQQRPLSAGNSDLEKLERLKKEILEGQNPIYKAIPQPGFLESLYLGRVVQAQSSVPAHADQVTSVPPDSNGLETSATSRSEGEALDVKKELEPTSDAATSHSDEQVVEESSVQATQRSDGDSGSLEPKGLDQTAVSLPGLEHISGTNEQLSRSSEESGQAAPNMAINDSVDRTNQPPNMPTVPSSLLPNSNASSTQYSDVSPNTPTLAFDKTRLTTDPPYDPKESLRGLKDSMLMSSNRNGFGLGPYDSFSPFGSSVDHVPVMEPESDRNGEWDKSFPYQYGDPRSASGDFDERRVSLTSSSDSRDLRYWHPKRHDSRRLSSGRAEYDSQHLAPDSPQAVVQAVPSSERVTYPANKNGATRPDNDMSRRPSTAAVSSFPGDYSSSNISSNTYVLRSSGNSEIANRGRIQRATSESRQSSINDGSTQGRTLLGRPSGLEERIGKRASVASDKGSGIRIPLEERLSSPPVDKSSQGGPTLQERIGVHSFPEDRPSSSSVDTSHLGDSRGIPTPLSLVRPRHTDGKPSPLSPVPASISSRQQVQEYHASSLSEMVERSAELLQPARHSASGSDSHAQASTYVPCNSSRASNGGPSLKEEDSGFSDPRLIPSAAFRESHDNYYEGGDAPGHYERPLLQERDSIPFEDRGRPSIEAREWRGRERANYPRLYAPRSEVHSLSGSPPRTWTSRNSNPLYLPNDGRDEKFEYGYSRRPAAPRSWERDDAARLHPARESYPPSDIAARGELLTASEYRERRVRGRSPSPNGSRRDFYSGPPAKRSRDEGYYDDHERRYPNHYGRPPSPAPSAAGGYYDERPSYPPEDSYDAYPGSGRSRPPRDNAYYDRRMTDLGGPPSPPPYRGRVIYSRPDLDKYNSIPPRTA